MDFDERLEEWFIPQLPINQSMNKRVEEDHDSHNKLAVGFNDYDECISFII